ncbi:LemA family protein [Asticcacaulis sp. SL142]|uniref:LemA family protein n=1 Tax=Asticcacaulis sp. SL142 TaxID=2995155 RepID=UPI00226D2FD5|nr:LemA family protein [Asticcacaulis sp. SL142]WAC49513.1 LemA family protein [Asticcacaulis sp. SL142]
MQFAAKLGQSRLGKRIAAFAALAAAAVTLSACGFNTIPTKQEATKAKWADVQSQYQRRADLIPNLVSTVQGAAIQERTTLTEVVEARAKATSVNVDASTITDPAKFQQFQQAQDGLSSALGRLMVVVERYPDLKSNQNFLALQSQLEGTENRINIARNDYNESARDFNTTLRTFPSIVWAKTIYGGEKPFEYFQAAAGAQNAPSVNFDGLKPSDPAPAAPAAAPATVQ